MFRLLIPRRSHWIRGRIEERKAVRFLKRFIDSRPRSAARECAQSCVPNGKDTPLFPHCKRKKNATLFFSPYFTLFMLFFMQMRKKCRKGAVLSSEIREQGSDRSNRAPDEFRRRAPSLNQDGSETSPAFACKAPPTSKTLCAQSLRKANRRNGKSRIHDRTAECLKEKPLRADRDAPSVIECGSEEKSGRRRHMQVSRLRTAKRLKAGSLSASSGMKKTPNAHVRRDAPQEAVQRAGDGSPKPAERKQAEWKKIHAKRADPSP